MAKQLRAWGHRRHRTGALGAGKRCLSAGRQGIVMNNLSTYTQRVPQGEALPHQDTRSHQPAVRTPHTHTHTNTRTPASPFRGVAHPVISFRIGDMTKFRRLVFALPCYLLERMATVLLSFEEGEAAVPARALTLALEPRGITAVTMKDAAAALEEEVCRGWKFLLVLFVCTRSHAGPDCCDPRDTRLRAARLADGAAAAACSSGW